MTPAPHQVFWRERRLVVGLLPGLVQVMLSSTILYLPAAELTNALASDRYRIQWIDGSNAAGFMIGCMITALVAGQVGLSWCYWGSLLVFTVSGGLGGTVDTVFAMTPLRLLQGLGMGMALTSAMVLLWKNFPRHIPLWMALYGTTIFVGAISGVLLGGLLTYCLSWRWVFLINFPLGVLALGCAWFSLPDDRPAVRAPLHLDWVHLAVTVGWLICLTVVLDMGQFWGWLDSPYLVPWLAGFVVLFTCFLCWGILIAKPLINLRPLGVRHYALGIAIHAVFSVNFFVLLALLSPYMIDLRGYQWWQGSLVLLPAWPCMVAAVIAGLYGATLTTRNLRLGLGLSLMALATVLLSFVDLYTSKYWMAAIMAVWGTGVGLATIPVTITAFAGLTVTQIFTTAGIFNLNRFLPAFVIGTTLGIFLSRHTDAQFDRMRLRITHNRPEVAWTRAHMQEQFLSRGGGTAADKQAQAALGDWVRANSRTFAVQTILKYLSLITVSGLVLVLLLPRPPPGTALTGLSPPVGED